MLRVLFASSRLIPRQMLQKTPILTNCKIVESNLLTKQIQLRNFTILQQPNLGTQQQKSLLTNPKFQEIVNNFQSRTLIKYSYRKGKRKSVRAVLRRFYRLHWGGWIRTKCGRHKKIWKKSPPRKRRLRQHVFCNATQSYLLDKMVGEYWRKPKYWVDDPYNPYHKREEFVFATTKPKEFYPTAEQQEKFK